MGGKKKYIEMFGSFTEPFICFITRYYGSLSPSVPWHCWFGGRKGIPPKTPCSGHR